MDAGLAASSVQMQWRTSGSVSNNVASSSTASPHRRGGDAAHDGEVDHREQSQCHVPIAAAPASHLVLIQIHSEVASSSPCTRQP
jgi:hypothetical protein